MSKRSDRRREMERLLALRDSAGLSLRSLSEQSGVPVGTLSWWSHRLRQEAQPAFVEVEVCEVERPPLPRSSESAEIIVRHAGGMAVELRGATAERVVAHVLARIDRWS